MYISNRGELVICSGKKPESIAKVQSLHANGKISRRMAMYSVRVIMGFGITETFVTQLLEGEIVP